jgi:NAD(P)-dependent dehydrogenase (short-subunit alcohol dehydrogenase family)
MREEAVGLLDGKVVVVTGAGRGIGRAIALASAADGARVVVNDYGVTIDGESPSADVAAAVVDEITGGAGEALVSADTVATMTGGAAIVNTALDAWGRVDGVVCCAGIVRHRPFLEMTERDWDHVVDTHLKGTFTVFHAAAAAMVAQGSGGSLVAISSGILHGDPCRANYRAAKAGIVALMMSVALAGEADGYRANAIAPIANTRMTKASNFDARGEPEDVAPMAVYLLSDLSRGMNGRVLSVRGNEIAEWTLPTETRVLRAAECWTAEAIHRQLSQAPDSGA